MDATEARSRASSDHFALAAFPCGVAGLVFGFIPIVVFLGWLLALLAILLGIIGRKSPRRKFAAWGVGLGIVVLLTGVLAFTLAVVAEIRAEGEGTSYGDTPTRGR
jgi:hypothetical protein